MLLQPRFTSSDWRLRLVVICLLLPCLFLAQCKKEGTSEKPKVDNPVAYRQYISAYTSGTVSRETAVKLVFVNPQNKGEEILKPLSLDAFRLKPAVTGSTYWEDSQTLVFKPSELLSSGQAYQVDFQLQNVVADAPAELAKFTFSFQTFEQSMEVTLDGIEPYDPENLKWQKIPGMVQTADVAEANLVEKALKARQNNYDLNIKWEHTADGREHRFVIDSVIREEGTQKVTVTWDGQPLGIAVSEQTEVSIPSITDFRVTDAYVVQQPEQQIIIRFSDPLKPEQNLNGLVRLMNGQSLRFITDGNELRAIPKQRQSGAVQVRVETGVRNHGNYQLAEAYATDLSFQNIKPEIRLVGKGVILPSSDGLNFPFQAVNLKAVKVKIVKIFENNVAQFLQVNQLDGSNQLKRVGRIVYKGEVPLQAKKKIDLASWNSFSINLSELIKAEQGAIYRVELGYEQANSLYPCPGAAATTANNLETIEVDDTPEKGWDGDNYQDYDYYYDDYDYGYDYDWNQRENPCSPSDYTYQRNNNQIVRNVLASDLGIIAKGGSAGKMTVAVSDLRTTDLLPNVKVAVYNFQQQLIGEAYTNAEGLAEVTADKKPYLLIAEKGSQKGYLRLDDGSALSLSMFDVSGNATNKGIKGLIYGERGVWRPGDSLFLSFMLEDKLQVLPGNHPVVFELYNPSSQLVERTVRTNPVGDIYNFGTATPPDAPTGNWLAKVSVGGSVFTKSLKIETVKPNRLKINFDFGQKVLTSANMTDATLKATWLHGAIAKNLKADVTVKLSQQTTAFGGFDGYEFDDASREFYADEQTVFDGKVDANGEAIVSPKFKLTDAAPGMLSAKFKLRVFENSGDFSTDQFSIAYSPYSSYVGYKVPEGKAWNGGLTMRDTYRFPVATVDPEGNPVSRNGLKIEVYRMEWRWWWEAASGESLGRYVRNSSQYLESSGTASTGSNGKGTFDFSVSSYGRYFVRITDPVSGHSAGKVVYVYWTDQESENVELPGGATMLSFRTDKNSYKTGEMVTATFPSGGAGKALVSIENGSKVLRSFWVEAKEKETAVRFEATPEMAPNVFVSIALVQPHNFTKNDLPIRLYGIQRIKVENPATLLSPKIQMPDKLEPEQPFEITVSEENGRPMSYTLAMVDEGLLDLTRFPTPNPHAHFYAPDALGVKTWDMYDQVMGAYAGEMAGLLELGGDEMLNPKDGNKANRFKPVVRFAGPFMLTAGKSKKHTLTMPNYIGSVRTMVVAGYEGAYGHTEKAVKVKKPLMVLATLPRVLGPEETVKLPVTVFAMENNIRTVDVKLMANELFTVNGESSQSINFSEMGDQVVTFDLQVARAVGVGKIKVEVSSGGQKAFHEIEIQVRNPNPAMTEIKETVMEAGKKWELPYQSIGISGTNKATLEVSNIPPLNLESRLDYLLQYPHGCIEQTTSSVFPQLHLASLLFLSEEEKQAVDQNIIQGIERIARQFQLPNGGLSYWPSEQYISEWGTNYAGHFMLEAKAKGYTLPPNFLNEWVRYQQREANRWVEDDRYSYRSSTLIQAYRLYTLALAQEPSMGAMNRLRETKKLPDAAKWRLAGAYVLAGQPEVAQQLVKNLGTSVADYQELSYGYGSALRDKAMILEVLTLLDRKLDAKSVIDDLSKALSTSRWLSTQETAYSLLAVAKFLGKNKATGTMNFRFSTGGASTEVKAETPVYTVDLPENGKVTLENQSGGILFGKVILQGTPATSQEKAYTKNLNVTVRYTDLQGNPIEISNLTQGTDLMAHVSIENPGNRGNYEEMALTQVFPSGWEIRNLRFEDDGNATQQQGDIPEYQDIRDDRVLTYFDLGSRQLKQFKVLLNATYEGRFYLPSVTCEAMYDNEIAARKEGQWVNVIRTGN